MTPADGFLLFVIFLSLALSAFFTASETALQACSRGSMQRLERQGNRRAASVNRLLAERSLLAALPFGRMMVNVTATALTTWMWVAMFGQRGLIPAILVMIAMLGIVCWMLPKRIALDAPERLALLVARPTERVARVLAPILFGIDALAGHIRARFETKADNELSEDSMSKEERADPTARPEVGQDPQQQEEPERATDAKA